MTSKTALILSDIHYGELAHLESFGKKIPSSDDDFSKIAAGIVESLNEESIVVDFLLILGDLTSRGTPGEFCDINRFFNILRDQLRLSANQVFITYGNHDVDWNVCNIESKHQEHREAYNYAAANLGGFFVSPGHFTKEGPVLGCGITQLEGFDLISLNSGIECYSDQEIKHGKLGREQFKWIKEELKEYLRADATKIVILHHHLLPLPYKKPVQDLSFLEEGASTAEILGRLGIDIILHGHRHHPISLTTIKSGWMKPMTIFCAGSFGVEASHRSSGRLPNTYHTISIPLNSGKSKVEGIIKSFELNSSSQWEPLAEQSSEYSLNQEQWFGSTDTLADVEQAVVQLLQASIDGSGDERFSPLPHYENLPLSLRCILHSDLNDYIMKKSLVMNISVTGQYPKPCLISRLN
jgi:predicted phosphodiesterase